MTLQINPVFCDEGTFSYPKDCFQIGYYKTHKIEHLLQIIWKYKIIYDTFVYDKIVDKNNLIFFNIKQTTK